MAHHSEPMDVDCMVSDFDNKENTFHHNVPCTEKGYEELDVSELNMKLRYSMTTASTPMSKSYTTHSENRNLETGDTLQDNASLTRSLNSTINKNDNVIKTLKSLPLQSLSTDQFSDGNGNASVLRQLDSTDNANITVTISGSNDIDENLSLPSTSSSALHTPATTPTKEMKDSSPIMRGLKSVFNMFRSSTSPVPPMEGDNVIVKQEVFSPAVVTNCENVKPHAVVSTPVVMPRKNNTNTAKRSSPYKESVVFNDDLEKELNWKEARSDSSPEKSPVNKLLLLNSKVSEGKSSVADSNNSNVEINYDSIVEYMDISNNESLLQDKTMTELQSDHHEVSGAAESDSEFMDCETTFSKNESYVLDIKAVRDVIPPTPAVQKKSCVNNADIVDHDSTFSMNESYVLDVKGVQEIISPTINLDETKNVSCMNKSMLDCESTLVTDESYVLDIKEIQEKISPKLDLDKSDLNNTIVNETTGNATNFTFSNLDLNLDMTVPSDYSDYSQATTDILAELEKLETYNLLDNQLHKPTYGIATGQKCIDKHQDTSSQVSIGTPEKIENNQIENNDITESQDGLLNISEDKNKELETTLTEQSAEIQTHSIRCNESLIESDIKISQSQENNLTHKNLNDTSKTEVENNTHETTGNKLDTTIIQDSVNVENNNDIVNEVLSQVLIETPVVITQTVPSNLLENNVKCSDVLNIAGNDIPLDNNSEVPNNNSENVSLQVLNVSEDISFEALGSTEKDNVLTNVVNVSQNDATLDNGSVEQKADVTSDIFNITQDIVTVESSQSSFPNEPLKLLDVTNTHTDVSITENECFLNLKSIEKSDVTKISNVSQNNVIVESLQKQDSDHILEPTQILGVNEIDKENIDDPSVVPLPDDEDDKQVVLDVTNKSVENVVACLSETFGTLTEIEVSSSNSKDTIAGQNDHSIVFTSEQAETQIPDVCQPDNVDNKSSDMQILDISETRISKNDVMLSETDIATNKIETISTAIEPTTDINLTASEKNSDVSPEIKIDNDNIMMKEITSSVNRSQVNEKIIYNTTKINEESSQCADICNKTIVVDNPVNEQNTQNEPMDISMNESLNLHHKSLDLINNLNSLAEENDQIESTENDTDKELKQDELVLSETPELLKNIPEDVKCQLNFESNSDVTVNTGHGNLLISDAMNITELPLSIEKQPVYAAQNKLDHNLDMELNNEQPPKVFTNTDDSVPMEVGGTTADEEIIVSANNSPYVSVMSGIETVAEKNEAFEEIENPFVTNTNIASSPPISSKGYNFNFDDIDDPFATKTKIRLSPPLDSPVKNVETKNDNTEQFKIPDKVVPNRRQSQPPERRKPIALKKKLNKSFDSKTVSKTPTNKIVNEERIEIGESMEPNEVLETTDNANNKTPEIEKENTSTSLDQNAPSVLNTSETSLQESPENKSSIESVPIVSSDLKTTSSSEQSTYFSAGGSSTESIQSKNVFNLPEIDDMNFNPFATKSKMRQSPPPDKDIVNLFTTKSKMCQSPPLNTQMENPFTTKLKLCGSPDVTVINHTQSNINHTMTLDESKLTELVKHFDTEEKMETEIMEKDTSINITDTTSSSRTTDTQDLTTREVNTEDEDTIEGPFLDADDEIEKATEVAENDDLMNFNELHDPASVNEDNLDRELFIDAEAFEFLLNQNKSNVVADSGKESLFLKFDPLFAKRISSDSVLAALNKAQKKQSTPTKPLRPSLRNVASPIAGPSALNETYENENNISQDSTEDGNVTVTKPMMVVTPALNPAVTPRNKSITPVRTNRRSITFTSPAIAVIDRLLSMSANNSALGHDSSIASTQSHGEQTEADLALTQLRELLAEKEISVYNLRSESKELKDRLSAMETQVKILETDGQERLKKINELNERLAEKTKMNKSMAAVVEEYERTIASLIADIDQDKKRNADERIKLINERDEQTAHLSSMEVSFSDLHSKYEKSKQVILSCKANEDVLKKTIQDFEEQVTKMQNNYEMLKQHATAKLNHANQELEKINRAHEAEVLKLNAMIKRNQLQATSLQETLAQKMKANDELTAICDELINKVGSSK